MRLAKWIDIHRHAGFNIPALKRLSWNVADRGLKAVPWTEGLLQHEGEAIVPIPYSVSPLKLPEFAASLGSQDCRISESWRFRASSVKCNAVSSDKGLAPST
jgi:hypothetical protein